MEGKGRTPTASKVGDGLEPVIGDSLKDIKSQPYFCRCSSVFLDKVPFPGLDFQSTTCLSTFQGEQGLHWVVRCCLLCCPSVASTTAMALGKTDSGSHFSLTQLMRAGFQKLSGLGVISALIVRPLGSCRVLPDGVSASMAG